MNATLFNGGKVHWLRDVAARCGVGRNCKKRTWQMELGDVTCQRCVRLKRIDGRKESSGETPEQTRETRVLPND